jgi:dTDP-glucose pyrophosphorylase
MPANCIDARAATIRDAMKTISEGSISAAFAIDQSHQLVGVVTDGDLRRALLGGASLDNPVLPFVQLNPTRVSDGTSRSAVLDLMQAGSISQIPVVDENNRLVAIHLLRELLGKVPRHNVALVLAGGRGTRLRPYTYEIPKPMIQVAGVPILERVINHLVGYGIHTIVLSIGYLGHKIEEYFGDGRNFGCSIKYIREHSDLPLGTGGPLANVVNVVANLKHPVLVMNGDLVTQFDVHSMLQHHSESKSMITIGAVTYSHEIPFGVIQTTQKGKVSHVLEKPTLTEIVSGGIYVVSPELFHTIPEGKFLAITDLINSVVATGARVSSWMLDDGWLDVGEPKDLARAHGLHT